MKYDIFYSLFVTRYVKDYFCKFQVDNYISFCYIELTYLGTILQPFGYLIPHMNSTQIWWNGERVNVIELLSPHIERSNKMQQTSTRKPLSELNLLDDFLFNSLLTYPEYGREFCQMFLKILFRKEFKNLNIITQKSYIGHNTDLHGTRLDVYVESNDAAEIDSHNTSSIYDIEPDKNRAKADIRVLPKRVRFYHAIIDSRSLHSGQNYSSLKNVFVIFICPYDPFGDDRMIYTIKNQCTENPDLPYEDGIRTIFLYTKGKKGRDNKELSQLLTYMENTSRETAVTENLKTIQKMVDIVKKDGEVTISYMKGFERDQMYLEQRRAMERENTKREKLRADAAEREHQEDLKKIDALEKQLAHLLASQQS